MKNLLLLGNFLQILREEAWLVLCLVSTRRMMLMIKQSARSFLLGTGTFKIEHDEDERNFIIKKQGQFKSEIN